MKKSYFIVLAITFCVYANYVSAQPISITGDEKVGLGMYPTTYKLEVAGDIGYVGELFNLSDTRVIKNVKELDDEFVRKLFNLRGVTFTKDIGLYDARLSDSSKAGLTSYFNQEQTSIGFVAQEVKKQFPEIVRMDANGYHSINYAALIPVLIEAITIQQAQIDELKNLLDGPQLKSGIINDYTESALSDIEKPVLYQNTPNPFTEGTEISYHLGRNIKSANISIYDLSGVQLRSIPLDQRGDGEITINGGEFKAGIYIYTLIADGMTIDTRKMILTD